MASENVEIIRRGLDGYNAGDPGPVLEIADPDIEFVPLSSLLVGGSYRGHDGIRKFMDELREEWDQFEVEVDEFREQGDRVVLLGHFHVRGKASDVETRMPVAWVFELRDRKVVRMQAYSSQSEALGAVGLA